MNIKLLKVISLISIIGMIIVNLLANLIPFNSVTTQFISDSFKVFFVPAGYVFSIWGVIYIAMIIFGIYSFKSKTISKKVLFAVIISSLANALWIVLWHYYLISLTLPVMVVLLFSLIYIYANIRKESNFLRIPISIYMGWISVATIANATVFLDNLSWNGFGLTGDIWTGFLIIIAGFLGLVSLVYRKDWVYPLVIIWAIIGIGVKFSSNQIILVGIIISLILMILGYLTLILSRFRK